MMKYTYTEVDRLENPHNYMYTSVVDKNFISIYAKDRILRSEQYFDKKHGIIFTKSYGELFHDNIGNFTTDNKLTLDYFSTLEKINTSKLLQALLVDILKESSAKADFFLSKLIQRFEVSKKLYTIYSSDIRKGEGDANNPTNYAKLALCLSVAYQKTGHLQYLSTQLKLLDLLMSLDVNTVKKRCPSLLIAILVDIELCSINKLILKHGFNISV